MTYSESQILPSAVLDFILSSTFMNTSFQYVKQSLEFKHTYTLQQSVIQILRATLLYVSCSLSCGFEIYYSSKNNLRAFPLPPNT